MKTNEQILDEMCFLDDQGKPIKNYSLAEMIEMAKQSEYGCVWYSDKGPIQITKEGKLEPILGRIPSSISQAKWAWDTENKLRSKMLEKMDEKYEQNNGA